MATSPAPAAATHVAIPPQPLVGDLLRAEDPAKVHYSFEFFPPRTEAADRQLEATLGELAPLSPVFIDVTWGAGGSTSEKTTSVCAAAAMQGLVVNMHLTCTNMPVGKVDTALSFCHSMGIRNLVALRGDPPAGEVWRASEEGFTCALDLIKYIKSRYGNHFSIAVAGYPEGHPDVIDQATGRATEAAMESETAYLKSKVDAGADVIITQLFYDVDLFLAFVARCRAAGITVPILPGLLPVVSYGGLKRILTLCKTYVPPEMMDAVEALKDDEAGLRAYGVRQCTEMCQKMRAAGVHHFHFYTLNQAASTVNVLRALGAVTAPASS